MLRQLAKLICLLIASATTWIVFSDLEEVFRGLVVPLAVATVAFILVFVRLYFLLARHIADSISDKLSVAVRRGVNIRSGSGIDFIPEAKKRVNCSMCGAPDGPICRECEEQMQRSSKFSVPP